MSSGKSSRRPGSRKASTRGEKQYTPIEASKSVVGFSLARFALGLGDEDLGGRREQGDDAHGSSLRGASPWAGPCPGIGTAPLARGRAKRVGGGCPPPGAGPQAGLSASRAARAAALSLNQVALMAV